MIRFQFFSSLLTIALLSGCGGGGSGDQAPKIQFSSVVSFGDSLSDVGTYSVGAVKALGGVKYTINSPESKNWIELLAAQLRQKTPCAAQTGLDGDPAQGFSVPVINHAGCTAYAQGGARVTNPIGQGNKLTGGSSTTLGLLTVPVAAQIQNHLTASGGAFKGDEIIFVAAGSNDVAVQLAALGAGGNPATSVTAMGIAGAELASHVNNLILGKGAKYVVVMNLPDLSNTPQSTINEMVAPGTKALINAMVAAFNAQLRQDLANTANIAYIDAYEFSRDLVSNPVQYGLINVTSPACDLSPARNFLGSALGCTPANLVPGIVDRYAFADTVHPTPYAHQLLARSVALEMIRKGWL